MKTILVVEDNAAVREEICDILMMEKYKVLEAEDGESGFDKALMTIPDLIVSDIAMPKIDGYSMFIKLQENAKTKLIPFIFLSAKSYISDIRRGMNLGAYDYLTKPVSANDLVIAIRKNLEKIDNINSEIEQMKLDLSKMLSHELRTPLNGIMGFTDFLKAYHQEMSQEKIENAVDYLNRSTTRLFKMVENYLLYAQLRMEKLKINNQSYLFVQTKFNTKNVIIETIKNTDNYGVRKNDISFDLCDVDLVFNQLLFEKMIVELIENAIKFSKAGQAIRITTKIHENKFELAGFNEGTGMKEEHLNKIKGFKQFEREEYEQQGSGLGLSIVKLITELNNLELKIKSVYGENFEAKIQFPL